MDRTSTEYGLAHLEFEEKVRRNLPWNYFMHSMDGGLFGAGLLFVSAETLMPVVIQSLGGPAWLICLMPIVGQIGIWCPSLLFAHHWQRLERHLPIVVKFSFFQRLAFLVGAILLFCCGKEHPRLAVAVVALCPLVSGLAGGVTLTAWQELAAKTIPAQRRSSLWAVRSILMGLAGIGVGVAVRWILHRFPGTNGYALLHLIAFFLLMASLLFFMRIRETPYPPEGRPNLTLVENLRRLPGMFARQRRVLFYLLGAATVGGIYVMLPWLGIHVLTRLGKPPSFMGYLLTIHMLGAIGGNLAAGYAGDRIGGKRVCAAARLTFLGLCLWAPLAHAAWEFYAIYALLGAAWYGNGVGAGTLELEICPREDRLSYLAVIAAVRVPTMLTAALGSSWLWIVGGHHFHVVSWVSAAAMAVCVFFTLLVREPRGEKRQPGQ